MASIHPNRRAAIGLMAAAAGLAGAGGASAQACFDPQALPASDRSLRRTLKFQEVSRDPRRTCGLCAFFTAAQPSSCGKCAMLSGGPVSAMSVCDSWAPKA